MSFENAMTSAETIPMPAARTVSRCLSCGSDALHPVLDLGLQPLANNLLAEADLTRPEPRFPLGIQVCPSCWLVQLTDLVPPVDLFTTYLYFSSYSDTMLRHAAQASARFVERLGLGPQSFVVEIASNDGYLLRNFVQRGIPCLGIEPAENIALAARERGVESLVEFFGSECAAGVAATRRKADLILGNNVFAHVPDINDFARGLAELLAPEGTVSLEFPYARELFDRNEFDTIYHEHVFYFSLTPLVPLFARHGLEIHDVERLAIHGGSLRIWAGWRGRRPVGPAVTELLEAERAAGLHGIGYYDSLAGRVHRLREDLLEKIAELKAGGRRLAAYGASAKGSTLLNFCSPPAGSIEFIADRSEAKRGLFSPGLHLPIVGPEELAARQPDYALLLTWNFAEEILAQQRDFRTGGGRFLIPIPEVRDC